MKTNSIKTLVGQIIWFLYFSLVAFILYKFRNTPILTTVIIVSVIIGLILWFFYTWMVKYF